MKVLQMPAEGGEGQGEFRGVANNDEQIVSLKISNDDWLKSM